MYGLGTWIDTEDFTVHNTEILFLPSGCKCGLLTSVMEETMRRDECGPQTMNNLLLEKP